MLNSVKENSSNVLCKFCLPVDFKRKSKGSEKVSVEDYTGKNYLKVQAILEVKGITVLIDYKAVDDKSKYKGKFFTRLK